MGFKTTQELERAIMKGLQQAVAKGRMETYSIIQEVLYRWYGSYSPKMYERTRDLFNSLVMENIKKTGYGYEATVYFDVSKMNYTTKSQPSGQEVLDAALIGRHGAIGKSKGGKSLYSVPGSVPLGFASLHMLDKALIKEMVNAMKAAGVPVREA